MTQQERIEAAWNRGESITALTAFRRWRCLRLAARVFDARRKGLNVIATTVKRGGKSYAAYRLGLR